MLNKKIIIILFFSLLYQIPLFSKSTSFQKLDSQNLSKYFSGIVAFENENNSKALDFFQSSKILLSQHDPYLERLVISLVLEDKVNQAINFIKINKKKSNSKFFEAYILLSLDSIKKGEIEDALKVLDNVKENFLKDRLDFIILNTLKDYLSVFKNKEIQNEFKNFGDLSSISETFQRCYLDDENTGSFFLKLINNNKTDYSRYIYFYLTYLVKRKLKRQKPLQMI